MPAGYLTLGELEKESISKHLRKRNNKAISCPNCDSQWFISQKAYMFEENHQVIVGQDIPMVSGVGYILLKCVRCDELIEPRILHNARDVAGGDYDYLVSTLEGEGDKRNQGKSPLPSDTGLPTHRV